MGILALFLILEERSSGFHCWELCYTSGEQSKRILVDTHTADTQAHTLHSYLFLCPYLLNMGFCLCRRRPQGNADPRFRILVLSWLLFVGFPVGASGKERPCQCRRYGFDPWVGKIPWRRKWQPTPVFLPGKSHGQRILEGYSLWGQSQIQLSDWTHFLVGVWACWDDHNKILQVGDLNNRIYFLTVVEARTECLPGGFSWDLSSAYVLTWSSLVLCVVF